MSPPKMKYRVLPTSAWDSPAFARLPPAAPCARYLLRYLELGPHTTSVPGLFRAGVAAIAERLGWEFEVARGLFRELEAARLLVFDAPTGLLFLPHAFDYDPPQNTKSVKGWRSSVRELPDCALKSQACAHLHEQLRKLDAARDGAADKDGLTFAQAGSFLLPETVPDTVSGTVPPGYGIPQTHRPKIHHPRNER
jgi:hypothetical protein